jgi:pilus assembly protein Flp/PilA
MASEGPQSGVLPSDEGASAVEYGLLIFAIAAVIVAVVFALGGVVGNLFSNTCSNVASLAQSSTC